MLVDITNITVVDRDILSRCCVMSLMTTAGLAH